MKTSGNESVTDREGEVVQLLWRLRFLAGAQLAEFLFGGSSVGARSRVVMTQRLLAALKRRGLVAGLPRAVGGPLGGETAPVYYLTTEGFRTARALWQGGAPKRLKSPGTFLRRHALATADVVLAFRRAAYAGPEHELVAWECDWQAALPIGSSVLEPDAYLLFRVGERRLHAFVEVDMLSEHTRFVAAKLRRYLELHRGASWRTRFPVWPLVLVVAETEARAQQLRRICEAVSAAPGGPWTGGAGAFLFASFADVTAAGGPLREIWRVVGRADRVGLTAAAAQPSAADRP